MKYREADIEALKAPDVLHAYCTAALGAGRRFGNVWKYPCPYGAHTRLKLEVGERNGCGVAICRACNAGGNVFNIAAAVRGLDARRDFIACVEEVAEQTGYHLTPEDDTPPTRTTRPHHTPPARPSVPHTPAEPPAPAYLPPEDENAALAAVRHAAAHPEQIEAHAAALGLPPDVLHYHADMEAAPLGLLGITPAGLLLYVYTATDEAGRVRVQSTKTRNAPGREPRFIQRGSKAGLWGAGALQAAPCRRVIITEGESDCLALRAAVWAWLTNWAHDEPDTLPAVDSFPLVLAKPDAGTFRDSWAAPLRGLDVILAIDADEAGRKGAEATAATLRAAGVRRIFTWQPPAPHKDARAALDPARPWLLAEHLMTHKTPLFS